MADYIGGYSRPLSDTAARTAQITELLAIKLYEHADTGAKGGEIWGTGARICWLKLDEETRGTFRSMARGEAPLDGD